MKKEICSHGRAGMRTRNSRNKFKTLYGSMKTENKKDAFIKCQLRLGKILENKLSQIP
jgi:hypothetical protein